MKTEPIISIKIHQLESEFKHILNGKGATIFENAPVALQQLSVESMLKTLYWVLDKKFKSKLKWKG